MSNIVNIFNSIFSINIYSSANIESSSINSSELKPSKRHRSFTDMPTFLDRSSLYKNSRETTYKMFKTIFAQDMRQIYPTLIFNALNTYNFKHLAAVMNRIAEDNCTLTRGQIIKNGDHSVLGPCEVICYCRPHITKHLSCIFEQMPDGVCSRIQFQLLNLSHIPATFSGASFSLFDNITALNEYLVNIAKRECVPLSPGFANLVKFTFSGTSYKGPTAPTPSSNASDRSYPFSNVKFDSMYIQVLNENGKIIRFENYIQDANSRNNPHREDPIKILDATADISKHY